MGAEFVAALAAEIAGPPGARLVGPLGVMFVDPPGSWNADCCSSSGISIGGSDRHTT